MVVAFRKHTLLPLDDCLYALQATIPHLTRSSLHRCFVRHRINRLASHLPLPPSRSAPTTPGRFPHCLQLCQTPQNTLQSDSFSIHLLLLPKTIKSFLFQVLPSLSGTKQDASSVWPGPVSWQFYSWRNASIGSSRAARRAGVNPNKTPTAAENRNAIALICRLNWNGTCINDASP